MDRTTFHFGISMVDGNTMGVVLNVQNAHTDKSFVVFDTDDPKLARRIANKLERASQDALKLGAK